MAQAYFDCNFSYEMAVEADELAQQEEAEGQERARTHAMTSEERATRYADRAEIRSTQSGGANTRPRIGTLDERRALAAIHSGGKGKKDKEKSGGKTFLL